ncbi:ESAT-6 like protein EsxE [Mycobacterium lepraemurium]|nr:ESAT-6 like protein EsxE [Mycobacterium lepraemurium]
MDPAALADAVQRMAEFQRYAEDMIAEIDSRVTRLHQTWTGEGAAAHAEAHQHWVRGEAMMREALAQLGKATESKPPAGGTPPAAEPPKPTTAPHSGEPKPIATPPESVGKPVTHAPAGDGTTPAVPAAAASLPVESTAAAATHLPTPPSLPMGGGAPPKAPSGLAEVPRAGEPSAPPTEPHGGGAHPRGDGTGPPHPPGDGDPHPPGDGNGPHDSHPGDGGPHSPGDGNGPHDSHPGDDSDMPGDHHPGDGSHNGPPRAGDVFPDAKEFGELSETEYRKLFEDENGRLRYPDVNDPAKPYAIPGTVRDLTPARISALHGQWLDRIGRPDGR